MGNSSSSSSASRHDDSVDYGQLVPQGVYTGQRDWNQSITAQLIIARKLAPFYRPLEDYEDTWDDDQILAARKPLPDIDGEPQQPPPPPPVPAKPSKRPGSLKEPAKPEATVYRGAVECPICFLYYPPNINHSRCCDQAICTECFVQIKRSEPTTTHLVSEPAACPYCVQDNFGVVYSPPPWRAGIGSEGTNSLWSDSPKGSSPSIESSAPYPTHKRRQKSFSADSPEVVLTDHIRPDWEAKLAAVRAAVTRRANRRIIMRQVGDRLIPRRRRQKFPQRAREVDVRVDGSSHLQMGNFEQFMGMGGQELEELMLMEAMRLSLLDHEEHQRKEAEEKKKKAGEASNAAAAAEESASAGPAPGPSTLEARPSSPPATGLNLPSPSPSGSTPTHSPSALSVSRNGSRSRSPSPNPLQALKDTASGWRTRTSSPPPFSTLGAALSGTVSTASAVINGAGGEPTTPTAQPAADPPSSQPSGMDGDNAIPTITVAGSSTPKESASPEPSGATDPSAPTTSGNGGESTERENPVRPAAPNHQESFTSVVSASSSVGGIDTYDNLPSSPESLARGHEPLLSSTSPATPKNHTAAANGDQPADYVGGASVARE
ncbi:zf-C3HC4 type zinc finger protein [Mycena olivaceomarginata]|nr:zf-C3HC4 type zinc finger protein [Mycena olivaceomarginata]